MHALDILGDPVRRRLVELLAAGERSAGDLGEVVQSEFGISQPAVSQHLRVLREAGFATVRRDGARRLYSVDPAPLEAADAWFDPFRRFWQPHLDALGTELARGRRAARLAAETGAEEETDASTRPDALRGDGAAASSPEQGQASPAPGNEADETREHEEN